MIQEASSFYDKTQGTMNMFDKAVIAASKRHI